MLCLFIYSLYQKGYINTMFFNLSKNRLKFFEENIFKSNHDLNKNYKRFDIDENIDLPFDIYVEKPKRNKLVLPRWLGIAYMNREFLINLFIKHGKNLNMDDPNLDQKLIYSIIKELDNIRNNKNN